MTTMERLAELLELLQQLPEEAKQEVYRYMQHLKKQQLGGLQNDCQ